MRHQTGRNRRDLVKDILAYCNWARIRVTYGAVGGMLDVFPRNVASIYLGDRRPEVSWIVNKKTKLPTCYSEEQMHPDLRHNRRVICCATELERELREAGFLRS